MCPNIVQLLESRTAQEGKIFRQCRNTDTVNGHMLSDRGYTCSEALQRKSQPWMEVIDMPTDDRMQDDVSLEATSIMQ